MILREQIVVRDMAPSNGEGNDSGFDEEDWKGIDMKQKNIKKHKNQSRRRLYTLENIPDVYHKSLYPKNKRTLCLHSLEILTYLVLINIKSNNSEHLLTF